MTHTFTTMLAQAGPWQRLRRLAKATPLVLALGAQALPAVAAYAQTITLTERKVPFSQVLKHIEQQSGYTFLYNTQMVAGRAAAHAQHGGKVDYREAEAGRPLGRGPTHAGDGHGNRRQQPAPARRNGARASPRLAPRALHRHQRPL